MKVTKIQAIGIWAAAGFIFTGIGLGMIWLPLVVLWVGVVCSGFALLLMYD